MLSLVAAATAQIGWTVVPQPQAQGVLAYDSWRERLVLFDGLGTHEFDGTAWMQIPNSNSPVGGSWMVFDEARGRVVMPGLATWQSNSEVWEWDGTSWQSAGALPSSVMGSSSLAVYNESLGQIVVCPDSNGWQAGVGQSIEIYSWNGQTFSVLQGNGAPPLTAGGGPGGPYYYYYHSMAYDRRASRLVLFGRTLLNQVGPVLSEPATWEWDPINGWVDLGASGSIGTTTHIWFDAHRGHILRHDSSTTGASVYMRQPAGAWTAFPAQGGTAFGPQWFACDHLRGRTYGYGSSQLGNGYGYFASVNPALYDGHSVGCPYPTAPSLTLTETWTRAWLGGTLSVDIGNLVSPFAILTMGFDDQNYNGSPLPLSLAAYGMPTCFLNVAPAATIVAAATNNTATVAIPIPNSNPLVGVPFFQQAFAAVPGANALGVSASQSMRGTVGRSF